MVLPEGRFPIGQFFPIQPTAFVFAVGDFHGSHLAPIDWIYAHYFTVMVLCGIVAPTETQGDNIFEPFQPERGRELKGCIRLSADRRYDCARAIGIIGSDKMARLC